MQFQLNRVRFANTLILGGILYVIALVSYAAIRGSSGYYLVIGAIVLLFLVVAFRLPDGVKLNITMVLLSTGITIFLLESILGFGLLERIDSSDPRAPSVRLRSTAASKIGKTFDERSPIEVIIQLRHEGIDAYPSINPFMLKKASAFSGSGDIFPLGGISGKTIVSCNEIGDYLIFESDEQGFHNPPGLWTGDNIDIVTVGDSLTHGECVGSDKSTAALIRKVHENTLNLAASGSGPLVQLALIKEYMGELRPNTVLWFYCECNDLSDMRLEWSESYSPYANYLESDFRQELRNSQQAIDNFLSTWSLAHIERILDEGGFRLRPTLIDILKLRNLRTLVLRSFGLDQPEALDPIGSEELELYSRVLRDGRDHVASWGGTLYLVYLPTWVRYGNPDDTPGIDHEPQLELIPFYDRVLSIAEELGIRTIDLKKEFDAHPDPLSLWPFRLMGHFNEDGYKFVAGKVLENLEMDE